VAGDGQSGMPSGHSGSGQDSADHEGSLAGKACTEPRGSWRWETCGSQRSERKNRTDGKNTFRVTTRLISGQVEYYPPQTIREAEEEELEAESEHMGEEPSMQRDKPRIGPSLAALGIYAHSVKPTKDWLTKGVLEVVSPEMATFTMHLDIIEPPHILYNLSESTVEKLLASSLQPLVANSLVYMRRVYPKFTRIFSSNLVPLKHWRSGRCVHGM
jgi:Phosphatidylinositol-specific phospholipase C, Y domain